MTREEAIKEITNHLNHWKRLKEEKICSEVDGENAINAFNMAIKALGQETTTKIEESNFSQEQYLADIQSAYDCGKSVLDKKGLK